jgi:hypothetical protein
MPGRTPGKRPRRWRSLSSVASPDLDLDLLAASLRADTGDLGAYVESLAAKLEQAVPRRVRVERRRGGLFGPKAVRSIALDAGDRRLTLTYDGGALQARMASVSAGIVLKNESIDAEEWVQALGQALAAEASRSESTRRALERLLTG